VPDDAPPTGGSPAPEPEANGPPRQQPAEPLERPADEPASAPAPDQLEAAPAAPGRGPRNRRPARILALETLYETDVAHHPPGEVLQRRAAAQTTRPEMLAYARELLDGVLRHRQELDDIIQRRASQWPMAQMAAIDRNILRLALYECLYRSDTVPVKVAINEAVELAKLYGSESSARFINGVVGRVVGQPDDDQDSPTSRDQN
jgi:N utilization substance protein B